MRRAKLLLLTVAVSVIVIISLLLVFFYKRPVPVAEETAIGEEVSVVEENPVQEEVFKPIYGGDGNTPLPPPMRPSPYQSIEELPGILRQRIDELHEARERDFTALDGIIADFSITDVTVAEGVAQLGNNYNVLCGIEVIPWLGSPEGLAPAQLQRVSMSLQQTTPRQILDKLVSLDPTFTWVENEGVANLVIRKAYDSPNYPLNKRIAHFKVNDRPYTMVFGGPYLPAGLFQLPEVYESLVFGSSGRWPREFEPLVSLDIVDATVRDITNKVALKVGMPWSAVLCETPSGEPWVSFHMHPKLPVPRCFQEPETDANQP